LKIKTVTFHPVIEQWFDQQFAAPSPPQEKGWPSIAKGSHTLILAPTGSGKTLAAFLWSIDQLLRSFIPQFPKTAPAIQRGAHPVYFAAKSFK
jgi:ATP-dependent Lhr-like helicase